MVDGCHWSDGLVELQMWSRLSVLAFNADNHSLVLHCGQRAVEFADSDKCLAKRQPKKPDRCENNLTSLSAFSNWELSFSANLANLASVTGMLKVSCLTLFHHFSLPFYTQSREVVESFFWSQCDLVLLHIKFLCFDRNRTVIPCHFMTLKMTPFN